MNNYFIIGKVNEGKSHLFNLFSKDHRTISNPKENTTVDIIRKEISTNNFHYYLYDTPGFYNISELKEIYDRRIKKGNVDEPDFNKTFSYGGQFHLDYPGLENNVVLGMGGYGGKAILIDVENSRIVAIHAQHYNNQSFKFSIRKLLIDPIKNGFK